MARRVSFGLAIGDQTSHGPVFPTEAQAGLEGQVIANAQQVDVTVYRFEVDEATTEIVALERMRVFHPQQP